MTLRLSTKRILMNFLASSTYGLLRSAYIYPLLLEVGDLLGHREVGPAAVDRLGSDLDAFFGLSGIVPEHPPERIKPTHFRIS